MSRFVSAAAALLCALAANAQVSVREPATKAYLAAGKTTISLALRNTASQPLQAIVLLEWLGPDNKRHDFARTEKPIPCGDSSLEIALPLTDKFDPLVERLRYDIQPSAPNYTAFLRFQAAFSLPTIAGHAFAISVLATQTLQPGKQRDITVLTFHPVSGLPVSGVQVSSGKTTAVSDRNGIAILPVAVPSGQDDDPELQIDAHLGDYHQHGSVTPTASTKDNVRIYTDKPLYQPGQTVHVRILALSAAGPVRANTEHQVRIVNENDEPLHTETLTTSRFGIAATDWEIPPNAKAGEYKIEVERDGLDLPFTRSIEIRRYELPSFRVAAASARPYYLLHQQPEIEIHAAYLFGKPLPNAVVRISEPGGNRVAEGKLDTSGTYRATLKATTELPDAVKFQDRHFTAFVTDPTTNRTEQREFDVRISRSPLHIYVAKQELTPTNRRLYVVVDSPDGSPAKTGVQLLSGQRVLASAATNRFGVARIEFPKGTDDNVYIVATAPDGTSAKEAVPATADDTDLWLDTGRILYRPGQDIQCHIASTGRRTPVVLLAWNSAGEVVYSRSLALANGEAAVAIPHTARSGRVLSLAVVSTDGRASATRIVIFPGPDQFTLHAIPAKATYRPGETATVRFQSSSPSALGIAIVDQSVLERAATDSAFHRANWFDDEDSGASIAGLTQDDLLNLDPANIDEDLQLLAAAMLPDPLLFNSAAAGLQVQRRAFEAAGAQALARVREQLDQHYIDSLDYPTDQPGLNNLLGPAYTYWTDPWMRPWYTRFTTEGPYSVLRFLSAGPDKQQDTSDDYTALEIRRRWFASFEALIRGLLKAFPDNPATPQEFVQALDEAGIRFTALRDPWGSPLHVAITYYQAQRRVQIRSAGPDHTYGTADDFTVAEFVGSYFATTSAKISAAVTAMKEFPTTPSQAHAKLLDAGIDFDALRDPWGRPYYITVETRQAYGDFISIYNYSEYQGTPEQRRQLSPIKQTFRSLEIRSAGEDGIAGTYDDFALTTLTRRLDEQAPAPRMAASPNPPTPEVPGTGTIAGTVTDASGAVIPNARVTLNDTYITEADMQGRYVFKGVKPGDHRLKFESPGFQMHVIDRVPVAADHVTQADTVLNVGSLSETVEVTAMTMTFARAMSVSNGALLSISTPRVREYFPETLYWQPELITDSTGAASVRVKLADSITNWRVAAIASTEDGHITETTTDIRAFQPFMVDLDVPPVLTAGDEIDLPVPVRNYREQAEKVRVSAVLPHQISVRGNIDQPPQIAPSSSANATVPLRAESPVESGRVRVTGIGNAASDAIEKPVSIHPDGERHDLTVNGVAREGAPLHIEIPSAVIAGSLQAEVKFYPSLLSRLLESMASLLTRPDGCGEQTISSTYPNLMFLRAMKNAHLEHERLQARAMKNLVSGYQRLLGYQSDGGGFTYWGHGEPDIALTSYAVRFLTDARDFIAIDDDRLATAQRWLKAQRSPEPSVEALRVRAGRPDDIDRTLGDLARQAAKLDDPYSIAVFALAAMDAGKKDVGRQAIGRLCTLSQDEQGAAFWSLRANTPFHGWGRSGQVETTALAVSALAHWRKTEGGDQNIDTLIDRGVLFLLKNSDRSGAWATTQSTVRVLDALLDVWSGVDVQKPLTVTVLVNNVKAGTVSIPAAREVRGPLTLDISQFVHPGTASDISFAGTASSLVQAQINAAWYETWKAPRSAKNLLLDTKCTPGSVAVNEPVTCDILLSRPSFRGYGMVIAEIGLPPGADVDRGTLSSVLEDPKSGVDSFEVAPDHVTFYIWPRAADSKFHFVFRPRFPMKARSAASLAYDYYNPDEQVVIAPPIFTVR